jgi:hypothetical protein
LTKGSLESSEPGRMLDSLEKLDYVFDCNFLGLFRKPTVHDVAVGVSNVILMADLPIQISKLRSLFPFLLVLLKIVHAYIFDPFKELSFLFFYFFSKLSETYHLFF